MPSRPGAGLLLVQPHVALLRLELRFYAPPGATHVGQGLQGRILRIVGQVVAGYPILKDNFSSTPSSCRPGSARVAQRPRSQSENREGNPRLENLPRRQSRSPAPNPPRPRSKPSGKNSSSLTGKGARPQSAGRRTGSRLRKDAGRPRSWASAGTARTPPYRGKAAAPRVPKSIGWTGGCGRRSGESEPGKGRTNNASNHPVCAKLPNGTPDPGGEPAVPGQNLGRSPRFPRPGTSNRESRKRPGMPGSGPSPRKHRQLVLPPT